ERAFAFASEQHIDQKRMSGEPYIEHPIAVAGILAELGMDDVSIAAGLLHDVPEDCGISISEIQERFGPEVAQLVDGVTKLKHLDFDTRQEKQAENLRKLFLAMAGDIRVVIIKLADRLHNIRTLDPFPEERKREIATETLNIFAPIAHRLGIWRVKWELEDRCFKYLEPQVYKQIYALVQRTRTERSQIVEDAIHTLQQRLVREEIDAEVTGRPKHFYSIYQKMIKQGLRFDKIHDLSALRVICNTERDCYHVLGIVHALWMQVEGMFSDYIAKPKPNNYQSLHTKVLGPEGELIEVQIRTRQMHRESEYGIAAHWRYKEGDHSNQYFNDKLNWLRFVLELQNETADDAKDFLDSLQLDLGTDQIFAFTPQGNVIYMPSGSTPVDFAFRVHSEVGNKCIGARVNGRMVPLNYKLHNGDICEITTSKSSKGPKRGWLDFVITPHAKNRIKSFLRKQAFEDNYREGMKRLEKVAQAERLKLGNIANHEALRTAAKALKQKDVGELIAAIGYGEFSAENILQRIRPELRARKEKPESKNRQEALSGTANSLLARTAGASNDSQQGDLIFTRIGRGLTKNSSTTSDGSLRAHENLKYTLARCCAPLPGDEVRGYVTRGRGVTVHRVGCPNLRYYEEREPHRLLRAQWSKTAGKTSQTLVAIESDDRVGLLHDVTSVIAKQQINIIAVSTYPLRGKNVRLNIAVAINGIEQLNDLIELLQKIPGVAKVHRV
ncbi:MAG: bifunctional (p)ppGpp synthetase/guanosine-3',5'-bis(diphosphate) 3'-pyrophosphohydrolase, partial [Abditibacteriaceae bacterium]